MIKPLPGRNLTVQTPQGDVQVDLNTVRGFSDRAGRITFHLYGGGQVESLAPWVSSFKASTR